MDGCDVGKWCLPSVSQIQISLTLFNVYTLQHARFQPHRAEICYIHACMSFKHQDLLFKYLNSTLHWLWPHLVFYTHTVVFSFVIVPLTFSRACMHTQYQSALSIAHMQSFSPGRSPMHAHTHTSPSPSYRAFFISHACMRNDRCSSMYVCIQLGLS